jgi:cobalamin biosynthesis Mg chelatase CobN
MEGVKLRLAGGLAALIALVAVAAPAWSQSDGTERFKAVKKVYRDYRDDGVIEACDHTRKALQRTLDDLPPEADIETPDLRPALEAAIEQVKDDNCPEPTPTATPSPSATPAPTAAPAPTTAPAPTPDDSLGSGTPPPSGGGGGGGGGNPPSSQDVTPLDPSVTPVPEATPPAAVTPPAEPSGPAATPAPVYVNADDGVPIPLLVLAGLLALVALLALVYAALSRLGWGERRLAGIRRAWREATFRAGGTWGDFADWMRAGR